jgi:hypothetical protein
MTTWQPIDTSPKDGTVILVYPPTWKDRTCSMAKWDTDQYATRPRPYWHRLDDMNRTTISRNNPPTHWMPLPEAPQ